MSSKSKKWDQKIQKKLSAHFPFFQFSFVALSSHWYQHWVKAAQHVLKHAEKQSETRRVQCFGAKSGASAAVQKLKALIDCLLSNAINRLSDLNSLGDIAI